MSGIIEIWRREAGPNLPVRFTVGNPPVLPNGDTVADAPTIKNIVFRESGSFAGLRLTGPVFCITFDESFVQRFIPEREVIDAAYETKKADAIATPKLEG